MKILITTGIYPPKIGGPAQYARHLFEEFNNRGHDVTVKTFGIEDKLPTGVRHLYFFLKILKEASSSDIILALDTFSVGLPSVLAGKLLRKKTIIRTGGDFLWEQYIERTGRKVFLRNFYNTENNNLTFKERLIFQMTGWTLRNVSHLVFSTLWQKNIFVPAYDIELDKISIIENFYGKKAGDASPPLIDFVASTRDLKWKNIDVLKKVFKRIQEGNPSIELYVKNLDFADFMEKIKDSYAVILISLGDISPNLILDAIRYNRPFICTKEVGIYERIKDAGVFVDPNNEREIENAIHNLLNREGYEKARLKVRQFSFTHTWDEIAEEFLLLASKILI